MQIIPKKFFSFPTKLLDYLVEQEVTTLIWAVSALCIISTLKGFDYKVPQKIRKVIFQWRSNAGEASEHLKKYLPEAMYVNVTVRLKLHVTVRIILLTGSMNQEKIFRLENHFQMKRYFS